MSDTVPVVMIVEMNDCIDCGNRLGDNLSVLVPGPAHQQRTILPTGLLMLGPEEPPKYILLCEKTSHIYVVIGNRD